MLVFLPLLLVLQLLLTVGLALPLAALNVHLRDVEQILANGLVLLFFLSPILYPVTTVPDTACGPLYFLNPVAGLVQSYQNVIFFGQEPHWIHLGGVAIAALVALSGRLLGLRPAAGQPGGGGVMPAPADIAVAVRGVSKRFRLHRGPAGVHGEGPVRPRAAGPACSPGKSYGRCAT